MQKTLQHQVITDKRELLEQVGDWTTIETVVSYEYGENEITLQYKGKTVVFKNDIKKVAYIAYQFRYISLEQYAQFI